MRIYTRKSYIGERLAKKIYNPITNTLKGKITACNVHTYTWSRVSNSRI